MMMMYMKKQHQYNSKRVFLWMVLRALVLSLQPFEVLSWTNVVGISSSSATQRATSSAVSLATDSNETTNNGSTSKGGGDNKAMAFLRKIGKVGGNTDFTHALGVDEGESGKAPGMKNGAKLQKTAEAYVSCAISGIIDDVTQPFPLTSFGTSWSGFTDQVVALTRGGKNSMATLARRDDFHGRPANVLSGTVVRHAPYHKEGFIQMATNLANLRQSQTAGGPASADGGVQNSIDASTFQGVQLDVYYEHGIRSSRVDENDDEDDDTCEIPQSSFYVQLKTSRDTSQDEQPSSAAASLSYRAKFPVTPCIQGNSGAWTTVQIPWRDFVPHTVTSGGLTAGSNPLDAMPLLPLDTTSLVRMGIVVANSDSDNQENMAISEKIVLGISGVEFYKE